MADEDKVRGLSPYDLRRILGDALLAGVKLLGKKSDDTFENIKSDDDGRLQVYDPKVGSLISYSGITTADGAVDVFGHGTTLIDSVLTTKPDYDGNLVIITSGDYAGQARDINGATNNVTGTVTPSSAFGGLIVEGTTFVIVGIRTTPAEVAAIEAKLDSPATGLAAIMATLAAVNAKLVDPATGLAAIINTLSAAITRMDDPATGFTALMNTLGAFWNLYVDPAVGFAALANSITAAITDIGDASASTLGSLYAILGNPDTDMSHSIGHIPKYAGGLLWTDGTNGNDANAGTDPCKAKKTIGAAIGVANAGDRINVRAGSYDEALNMNKVGLELVCEQGTVLSNSTPGTVLVVSANYCRVVGAILAQAGQTGLQVTGNFCTVDDCLAFGCAVGFDDDGVENRMINCRSLAHTTTGFDISNSYGLYDKCVAAGTGAAGERGFHLSVDTADNNGFHSCHTLNNALHGWEVIADADSNLFVHCSMSDSDGAKLDNGTDNTWADWAEGSQIVAGQTRDQDLKDISNDIADAELKLNKLAGADPVSSSTTANWNTGTGTSGEAGGDVVIIGINDTKYKFHSLLLDVSALTDGASIHVKLFMQVNGVEKKVYDQTFTIPTGTTPPDTDGLWIVNGTVGIHEALRVEVYSDTDDGDVAIGYDYMLEVM